MAKVFVETDDLSKEEVVKLLVEKEDKVRKLESFKGDVVFIYEQHKVSDTCEIHRNKKDDYVKHMVKFMVRTRKG